MIKHYFLLGSNCRCKNLTNHNNVGNCRGTKPSQFGRKFVACYVVQPSSCIDLRDSGTNHGEQLSADACAKKGKRIFDSLKYILLSEKNVHVSILMYPNFVFHFFLDLQDRIPSNSQERKDDVFKKCCEESGINSFCRPLCTRTKNEDNDDSTTLKLGYVIYIMKCSTQFKHIRKKCKNSFKGKKEKKSF